MTELEEDWDTLALQLANDPENFTNWTLLISFVSRTLSKISPQSDVERFRVCYRQLLLKYPYLEQYWVNFAQLEFKLGHTDEAKVVYSRALSVLPYSLLVWVKYLEFVKLVELDYEQVLECYVEAEMKVGFHYHSYEFWKGYLEFEESHKGKSVLWYNLLKKVIEIPSYQFAYFFKILISEIEHLSDKETALRIVDSMEMTKKLKIDVKRQEWSKETIHDVRSKLKKTYTDGYITTQFLSFEMYQFEKEVKLEYFVPGVYQSYQDLSNWDNYLSYMELNGSSLQIKQLYHRALVPTASYPNVWLKFADYYIHKSRLQSAKNLLTMSLVFLSDAMCLPIQLKLIKLELAMESYIAARDITLAALTKNVENVELLIQLVSIEHMLMVRRGSGDVAEFKIFVVALLKDKPVDVSVTVLRYIAGFKAIHGVVGALVTVLKPQLEQSGRYWVLVLEHTEEKDMLNVYEEALRVVKSSVEVLKKWVVSSLAHNPSSLPQLLEVSGATL